MKEVGVIKPKKKKFDRSSGKELLKIRVAPYCRVSTDSAEQMASYGKAIQGYQGNPTALDVEIIKDYFPTVTDFVRFSEK